MIYFIRIKFICFLLLLFLGSGFAAEKVLIRFNDLSDYSGSWNLRQEIPRYIKQYLSAYHELDVEVMDSSMSFASSFDSQDITLVTLDLLDFRFYGYNIANYRIGGYNNYKVEVEFRVSITRKSENKEHNVKAVEHDSNLGFTVLGGPGGDADIGQNPYVALQKLRFGSPQFNKSLYGRALKKSASKIKDQLLQFVSGISKKGKTKK